MMLENRILTVHLLAAVAIVCLASNATASDTAKPVPLAQKQAVVDGNNAFALALFSKLQAESEGNIVLSPYSVSAALAMAYAGANGKTATEMADVLHFTLPQNQLPTAFAAVAAELHGDPKPQGYQLRLANRLWGQTGQTFLPAFLQVTRDDYGAELAQVDFAHNAEAARKTINDWVAKNTEEKIKDLLAPNTLNPTTTLVLTNAVYFKSDWMQKFELASTHPAPFLLTREKHVMTPMMRQTAMFAYRADEDVQILELPYVHRNLSMIVLLAREVNGITDLDKKLSPKTLAAWTSGLKMQPVEVLLPKFKVTSKFQLDKSLGSLGMPQAFSGNADFSGMTGVRDLFISAVIHKAFIDVSEQGTEAAAATAVAMARAGRPQEHPVFRADHPFVFLIRDNRTGIILFLGRVTNPQE
jgi:serine protease inhibitor